MTIDEVMFSLIDFIIKCYKFELINVVCFTYWALA